MLAFAHAQVFDGIDETLKPATVLVEGERIAAVSDAPVPDGVDRIDCAGRVLMPGLIDAHIHPDRALKRAVRLGVHCIEHGTLIEPDTARMVADRGTCIVPTLAVIFGLAEEGAAFGFPKESLDKLERIKDEAVERLGHMRRAGVKVGFGTDLIGAIQPRQCIEFSLRSPVFSNYEILHQATGMNAEILGAKGETGTIAEGAYADILVVDGNPLEDLSLMEDDGALIPIVMKGGKFHRGGPDSEAPRPT